jgi:arsenite methyltransferase
VSALYRSPLLERAGDGWLRPGGLALTERALSILRLPAGARIVDVGCGLGATVDHLRRTHALDAVGVDVDPVLVARATARYPGAPFACASPGALPLPDAGAAAVLLECTLAATDEPARLLAECRRVLAPEGLLAMTDVYARAGAEGAVARARGASPACAPGMMSRAELEEALARAGFTVTAFEDHSRALAALLGRVLMEHGTLAPFWGLVCAGAGRDKTGDKTGDEGAHKREAERAIMDARPGYMLLIARRREPPAGRARGEGDDGGDERSTS